MKNYLLLISLALLFISCANKNDLDFENIKKEEQIYSTKKAQKVSLEQAVSQIEPYQVIFVGDHHNTKKTHEFFNSVLEKLIAKGYKIHLANEWFEKSENQMLEDYTSNKFDSEELKKRKDWDKFSIFDWNLSKLLYETVKKSDGKLYGINISKDFRKMISSKELYKMNISQQDFYYSLDLGVFAHGKLVKPYLEHCNKMPKRGSENCVDRMYRVQVTWDTYMAKEAYDLSKKVLKTSKDKLLVFVGAFHIDYDLGIPLRFARFSDIPYATITNYEIQKEEKVKIHNNLSDLVYIYSK